MSISRDQAIRQITASHSGFPRRHCANLLIADPLLNDKQREVVKSIAPLCQAGGAVLLFGGFGGGKTHIACAMACAWYERAYNKGRGKAQYWTLAGLFSDQKSWFADKSARQEPFAIARSCGFLVLDELDATSDSMFDQRELRDLLDTRYRAGDKSTLMLTNVHRDKLTTVLDMPTLDRLQDGGALIELAGESLRKESV